jgi:hypothetical protein
MNKRTEQARGSENPRPSRALFRRFVKAVS